MARNTQRSGEGGTDGQDEPSVTLSRADLGMLLAAERRLSVALARPAEVHRFYLLAVEQAAELLNVPGALLTVVDRENPQLLRVVAGAGALAQEEGELLPIEGSFEGRVFLGTEPVRTADLGGEPDVYQPLGGNRRAGPAIATPLRYQNEPLGVLLVAREPGGAPFLERDVELFREFATPITAALQSGRQFEATRRSREAVEAWNREQALRRWIERYEAIATARVEVVFRLEPSGAMEWGGSTDPLFGDPPERFAPRTENLLERVSLEDRDDVREALERLRSPAGLGGITVGFDFTLPNGSVQRKRLTGWRLRDTGEVVGTIAPEVGAEAATEAGTPGGVVTAETIAENIVRSLRHQINNPLAAVIGRAQLMIREEMVQDEPSLRQSVETILFESERINRFVQDLQKADGLSKLLDPLPGENGNNW